MLGADVILVKINNVPTIIWCSHSLVDRLVLFNNLLSPGQIWTYLLKLRSVESIGVNFCPLISK